MLMGVWHISQGITLTFPGHIKDDLDSEIFGETISTQMENTPFPKTLNREGLRHLACTDAYLICGLVRERHPVFVYVRPMVRALAKP